MKITTLHDVRTELSADSIEWCPHPQFLNYFVCGIYHLENGNVSILSAPCRRKGFIYLYRINMKDATLARIDSIASAAILDMKWLHDSFMGPPRLVTVNAMADIEVFSLENEKLTKLTALNIDPQVSNLLALSVACGSSLNGAKQIIVSDSYGDITLFVYRDTGLEKLYNWSAHSFEAWTCTFDRWNENRIFTGGDDSFMHVFDVRAPETVNKILTNKSHLAGVTSLLSHPTKENILLTGSYDENVRIFDTRQFKGPLSQINLKGGIWRLKSDPQNRNLVLCACMYHNFSIIRFINNFSEVELAATYDRHNSICYGADWSQWNDENNLLMATCSFYDNKLCISRVENDSDEVSE